MMMAAVTAVGSVTVTATAVGSVVVVFVAVVNLGLNWRVGQ